MTRAKSFMLVVALFLALLLAGCGQAIDNIAGGEVAFEIEMPDGTMAQCVKVIGGNTGDVALDCDFDGSD